MSKYAKDGIRDLNHALLYLDVAESGLLLAPDGEIPKHELVQLRNNIAAIHAQVARLSEGKAKNNCQLPIDPKRAGSYSPL